MATIYSLTHDEVFEHIKADRNMEDPRFRPAWLFWHFAREMAVLKEKGEYGTHWYYTIRQGLIASYQDDLEVLDATITCLDNIVKDETRRIH